MDHWTENYFEEENNMLGYNRLMLHRFKSDAASLYQGRLKLRG